MITSVPEFFFRWSFKVLGVASGQGRVVINFFSEQGAISLNGLEYMVRKHGPTSGRWTMEREGNVVADARKPRAFFRSFEMRVGNNRYTVKAESIFTRGYVILLGGEVVGTIRPANVLSRRAYISCQPIIAETTQLFALWLVLMTWRRGARKQNG